MWKHLFDEDDKYGFEANKIERIVNEALKGAFDVAILNHWSLRDTMHIIVAATYEHMLDAIVDNDLNEYQKQKEEKKDC